MNDIEPLTAHCSNCFQHVFGEPSCAKCKSNMISDFVESVFHGTFKAHKIGERLVNGGSCSFGKTEHEKSERLHWQIAKKQFT